MQGEWREMKYFNYPHCDVRSSSTFLDIQDRIKTKPAPYNRQPSPALCDDLQGWGEGGGKEAQVRGNIYLLRLICMSLYVRSQHNFVKQFCPVLGCVWPFVTLGLYVACQAPLSMEFFRQECWGGLPFPPPGDLSDPRIKPAFPASPALQVDSLPTEPLEKPIILQLKRKRKKICLSNDLSHWFKTSLLSFIT